MRRPRAWAAEGLRPGVPAEIGEAVVEQIVYAPTFDVDLSVHVGFAERNLRVERQLPDGGPVGNPGR